MNIDPVRRRLLVGVSAAAASLWMPASRAAAGTPLSPERSIDSYRRILCGAEGEEVLWWFIGDIHYQEPGKSVIPIARSMTIAGYTAGVTTARAFRYKFREAGVIVDLASGEPLRRNPITDDPAVVPLVDEAPHDIDWVMQDDGVIARTQHGRMSTLNLRWTETSASLLLVETQPGVDSFGLAPGDAGADWKAPQSTRTVYAKRAGLSGSGFVPAEMIFSVAIRTTPPWLANPASPGDHWLIVRGLGQKSRADEVVNQDALDLVRRLFPKYL